MSAKLDQYREKYPLYKSVADDVLARALHKKYYSDVPFDTFSEKIGLPGLPDLTPAPALDQLRPDQELDPIDRGPTGTPMQNARRGLSRTGKQLLPGAGRAKENQALEAADAAGFTPKSTVEAKTPEELRQERISRLETDRARLEQGAREAAPRSAGEVATDYGLAINQGFKKIPGALAKVVNKDRGTGLTPQNEFALAIGANIGAKLGSTRAQELADRLAANTKPHSEFLQSFADQADEQAADAGERMSPRAKALGREFSEAEGIGGKAAFLAANPGFLADLTVQSAPFIATGGVAGKAVGAVAGLEAGIGANLATQGVMSAASSSEEAKAYVLGVPQEELEQLPEYKRLSGQYRPEQIRKILAEKASDTAFAAGLVINAAVLGATAKLSVVERAMHGAGEVGQTGSRVANTGIGALKEFGQEAPQGAGEQVATNVGQMTADNRVGLTDKVGEAAFVEGIVGAGPGGLAGFSQAPNYEDSEVGRAKQEYDAARTPTEKGKANTELIIAQAKAKMAAQGAPVAAPVVEPVQARPEVAPVAEPAEAEPVGAPFEETLGQPEVSAETGDVVADARARAAAFDARSNDAVTRARAAVADAKSQNAQAPSTVAEQDQSEDDELSSLLDRAFQGEQSDAAEPAEIAQIRDGIANGVKFSRTSAGVVEEAPSAEGIEVGEVSDSDAAKYFMPKEEVDSITEGLSVLAKNPKLFRRRLFDGKNMKYIARDGGLNRTGVSREEVIDEDTHEPRMETTHSFAVDQSGKAGVAKIIETDGRVWVDVSGMNRGRGNAEGVYSAAASLAFNTGRDFVEDPNGLSDDAMYRRTVHELSAILKRGDAKNVPAGPFLTSGRKGGPATTPIGKNEARDYNVAVRDRALAIHANTLLAIPEAANVHFDADSNRFTDPDGNVLSDGDLDRLAEHRQANPVGSAMVRGPRKSGGKRAAPVGSTSIKVFAIVEALKRAPTGPARTRLVERLRGIAASSDGLAQLTGILPSKVVGQSGGLTVDAVRNVVQKAFGKRAKKLIADGKLKIVKSETDVPDSIRQSAEPLSSADGTVQGFFDPASGNTYLLADNLADEASARAVMLHEEGVHAGLAEMIGPARINALADILDRLETTGTKADQETIAAAKKRVSDAGTEAKHRAEETVAYTVEIEEQNTDPSPMFRKVITRVHTAIRQWALRRGMGDLTVADIRQLAIGGLEYRARGQRVGPAKGSPQFSKAAKPLQAGTFYSALSASIADLPAKQMSADGWVQQIRSMVNNGKVKQDEVEWSGLTDWLGLQDGRVTKGQITEYLDANGVRVDETVLSGDSGRPVGATKFGKYTIPGGDNYREVLLEIPLNTETVEHYLVSLPNGGFAGPYNSLAAANERIAEESNPAKRAMMEVHDRGSKAVLRPPSKYNSGQFNSPHFDQPNILAHIRLNDRTDADGKRVLFVEELQSDWAQEGKKKGFKAGNSEAAAIKAEYDAAAQAVSDAHNDGGNVQAARERLARATDAYNARINDATIPTAPFIDKTDKWLTLALKRVVKMAVDGGYDSIAFANGDQNADHYDLSKQISEFRYEPTDDGKYEILAKDMAGRVVIEEDEIPIERIEELVGKDIAKKVEAGEGEETVKTEGGFRDWRKLTGLDLKVGGEGMRAFYDRIVPNTLNALLRKVGGGKVTPIEAQTIGAHKNTDGKEFADQNVASVAITESIREKVSGGVPLFSKKAGTPATKDLFGNAPSETAQGLADRGAKIDAKLNGGGRVVKPSEGPGDLFGGPRELTKDMFGNQETLFSKNADAARTAKAEAKRRRDEADAIITAVRVAESDIRDVAIRNERLATLEDRARRMLDQWDTNQEIREQIADANRDLARLRKRALAGDRTALKQVTEAENQVKSLRDDLAKAVAAKQKAITAIDQMNTLGGKIDAMDMAKYRSALVDAADAASAIAAKARSVADWWRSRELSLRDATERADTKRRAIARDYGITGPSMLWEYDPTRFDGASGWLHSLREKYQAKFLTFLDAQKDIEAATGQLVADSQNVWRAENLMHGRVENQLKGLEASYTKKIKEHLRKTGALALVEDFMEARAAPARNIDVAKKRPDMPDGGSGMTTAEAKAFLSGKAKGLRSGQELTDGLREQIMPVVRLLDAMRNETLLRLKTTGQITDAVYETLKANTSYAPLRGKNGEPVEGSGLGGTGFDVRGNPIKRALGRGTGNRATNIVAELIGDAEKSIVNGERLRVGKTLARLVLANPNKSLWEVEKVELEAKYSEAADVVYYGLKNLDQESIRFVEKGVPYKITLKDPRMRAAIKNLSPSQLNGMVKFMGALNRYFSAVFTRYNPFFVPINMARDLGMGLISVYAEHGASVAADVAIHYGSAMRAVWRAERGKSVANKYHTYFNEMSEAGGTTAFSQLRNVEDIASHIESDVKTIFQLTREGKPHKAIARVIRESSIVKLVGDVNEAVENAVRLSAYAALRDRGASISKAAEYAKEITVNFNRRGSETSFVNSIILFFNASVQGSTRVLQLMKNPKAVASVTAMGALQFAFAALAMSDEDDDGQTAWDKISEYEKARNFIIAIPSVRDGQMYVKTIKIPVPYGFNLFTYAGGKLAQAMMTKDKFDSAKFTNDMTVAAVDSISPLKFTEGWDSIKPQVVRVFDQRNQNRDNFGRRITNEVPYSDFERPRAYLGRASTPSYFVAAAKGLNWLGGGDEVTPPKVLKGLLDHSPEDLQFLAESFGGGLLKAVDQFGQLGGMVASGVEVRPHEVPILNRLYSEVTPERATADRFRTAEAEIAREKDRVKKTFYQRGEKAAEKVIADTPELKGAWLHRFKTTNDVRDKAGRIRLNAGPGTLVDIKKVADKEIRRIGDEQEAVYNDPKLSMSQRINAIRRLQAEREKVQRRVTIKFKETKR